MNEQQIRIALISNHPLFLDGIRSILSHTEAFDIMMTSNTVDDLTQELDHDPDIILLSQNLFEDCLVDGPNLSVLFPNTKFALMLSDIENVNIRELLHHNVFGYFEKDMDADVLVNALKSVHHNKYWFSLDMVQLVVAAYKRLSTGRNINNQEQVTSITPPPKELVSPREYEVLEYLGKGYDNQEIATALRINDSTVKNHISNMFKNNEVKGRTPLVLKALRKNWLQLSDDEDLKDEANMMN